ncbi:hypothetical protein MMG00_12035 [Ignatzschineria rhizosphaerae]|uniref:Uncharacterized protein n=1 Tax=Ignatzschineria rhizosphaerae TaxID=2923279 RepID=A0ABY3X2I9_9GAMM|nr:hypothetical protein [Ignatzschineria rhizosphaerae]UNM95914.1 hypothetical protein MMG00_12035 [Ignatzschineria rhizosphaerae]
MSKQSLNIKDSKGAEVFIGDTLEFTMFDLNGEQVAREIATLENAEQMKVWIEEFDGVVIESQRV